MHQSARGSTTGCEHCFFKILITSLAVDGYETSTSSLWHPPYSLCTTFKSGNIVYSVNKCDV